MFEEEAEEYAENRDVCGLLDSISEDLMQYDYGTIARYDIDPLTAESFKDGAEFGYNKAKEEDKWHYPSKGEYPKDEKEVLVYMWGSFYIGNYKHDTDDNNGWHFNDFDEESEQVTAWKEIIPPKEIKEK